eukprot:UN04988
MLLVVLCQMVLQSIKPRNQAKMVCTFYCFRLDSGIIINNKSNHNNNRQTFYILRHINFRTSR